jgi:hypothetical protein
MRSSRQRAYFDLPRLRPSASLRLNSVQVAVVERSRNSVTRGAKKNVKIRTFARGLISQQRIIGAVVGNLSSG